MGRSVVSLAVSSFGQLQFRWRDWNVFEESLKHVNVNEAAGKYMFNLKICVTYRRVFNALWMTTN
jgi:hypothetical protein